MKNPKWHRDEIILALDLYFRPDRGSIDKHNPNVIALSEELNLLPIISHRPDAERFRNPNGVGMKLSNFLAIDPSYPGEGLSSYSSLDAAIFHEFVNNREQLQTIAARIRSVLHNEPLRQALLQIEGDADVLPNGIASEGEVLYRLHKHRERNKKLVADKKGAVLRITGALACEVCGFDFARTYGSLGEGFIECHHIKPLAEYEVATPTKLSDLAVVCANCHRMLHRLPGGITIETLKEQLGYLFEEPTLDNH